MSLDLSLIERVGPKRILNELDRFESEQSLGRFIALSWAILEPSRTFVPGWHLDAICEHLEAVTNGQILRLLINVPPGCMKSLTTDVFWPAWEWGPKNRPSYRYVSASYSEELTIRDNRKCRTLVSHQWYKSLWGKQVALDPEQSAKTRFDNLATGFKIATSVGGLGTGERGDRFIIDDPHNVRDSESDAKRNATLMWFEETVPTRMNDPEKSAIIVIMQRVHDDDVSGLILEKELGYVHLCLPMEFEPERRCITPIFRDPRTEDGELLWPQRMPEAVVERDKKAMTGYAVASQYQQRPTPRGGGMFKREWLPIVSSAPTGGRACRGWDLAASEGTQSAYTSGVKIRQAPDGLYYIEHVKRFRGTPHAVEKELKRTAADDSMATRVSIPQDPGQAGKSQKTYLARSLAGYDVRFSLESGDKETRAQPLAAQAEAGNVRLVKGDWNEKFIEELTVFPYGKFMDQVDGASRAFNELVKKKKKKVGSRPRLVTVHEN